MQKILIYLLPIMLLVGCGSNEAYTIEVYNQSAKGFDSVHIFIDTSPGLTSQSGRPTVQPVVNYGPLLAGEAMPPLTIGELLGRSQPKMGGTAIFYAADTIIRYEGPYDEGLAVCNHYKITIDSSLHVNWAEWQ